MFLSPLAGNLGGGSTNALYSLYDDLRRQGRTIIDLVRGNVSEHGIVFPPDVLDEILAGAAEKARVYKPESLGQYSAREAIALHYKPHFALPASHVVITPGTSVSYWYAFKLLAEAGDEILCPEPSYPLFDYIAKLCDVRLTFYRLAESYKWEIDFDHLEHQITARTRAVVLISPHNPTGMVATNDQLKALAGIASRRNIPIISDEVFSEFLYGTGSLPRPAATDAPLVITLNGFSKMFALPGMKIGWMAVTGRDDLVAKVMPALEMISDTFLPVNEIAQFAVPQIFDRGGEFLQTYVRWCTTCRDAAVRSLGDCFFNPPQGGFYVTLPINDDEEAVASRLLSDSGILVHPGYFYDMEPDHLVMTFIHDPAVIPGCFDRMVEFCRQN
jgi:aspartate/methionine/tyrosine aminotransferase